MIGILMREINLEFMERFDKDGEKLVLVSLEGEKELDVPKPLTLPFLDSKWELEERMLGKEFNED